MALKSGFHQIRPRQNGPKQPARDTLLPRKTGLFASSNGQRAPKPAASAHVKYARTKNDQCHSRITAKIPAPNPNYDTVTAIFSEWAGGAGDKRSRKNEAS